MAYSKKVNLTSLNFDCSLKIFSLLPDETRLHLSFVSKQFEDIFKFYLTKKNVFISNFEKYDKTLLFTRYGEFIRKLYITINNSSDFDLIIKHCKNLEILYLSIKRFARRHQGRIAKLLYNNPNLVKVIISTNSTDFHRIAPPINRLQHLKNLCLEINEDAAGFEYFNLPKLETFEIHSSQPYFTPHALSGNLSRMKNLKKLKLLLDKADIKWERIFGESNNYLQNLQELSTYSLSISEDFNHRIVMPPALKKLYVNDDSSGFLKALASAENNQLEFLDIGLDYYEEHHNILRLPNVIELMSSETSITYSEAEQFCKIIHSEQLEIHIEYFKLLICLLKNAKKLKNVEVRTPSCRIEIIPKTEATQVILTLKINRIVYKNEYVLILNRY